MAKRQVRATAKGMLSLIDTFLSTADHEESEKLWDVMTALRGPDNGGDEAKFATTSIVRKTAFPKSFTREYEYDKNLYVGTKGPAKAFGAVDTDKSVGIRNNIGMNLNSTHHFIAKQQHAFRALNLSWEEKN